MASDINTAISGWSFFQQESPSGRRPTCVKMALLFCAAIVHWDIRAQLCGRNSLQFSSKSGFWQSIEKPPRDQVQAWRKQGWVPVLRVSFRLSGWLRLPRWMHSNADTPCLLDFSVCRLHHSTDIRQTSKRQ